MKFKIGIVGAGFVGSAADICFESIADIKIYDKYKPSESLESVVEHSKIIFLCLPTPMAEDGSCDTSIIQNTISEIDRISDFRRLLIIKSTVPPGTSQRLAERFSRHGFIFNPEFLTEANFIDDFITQDRILLGLTSGVLQKEVNLIESFYEQFIKKQKHPAVIKFCYSEEAEMVKYTANSFLATKVAYFNEIYQICQSLNLDYDRVIELVTLDKRIGNTHVKVPGPDGLLGFGKKCLPKDLNGLIALARKNNCDTIILDSVWSKNLLIRQKYDWEEIPGATTQTNFKEH